MKQKQLKTFELLKQIKKGLPFNKALVHGKESYLSFQLIKKVSSAVKVEKFYPDSLEEFFRFSGQSLFGGKSLPVILYAQELPSKLRKKSDREKFFKKLKALDSFLVVATEELNYRTLTGEFFKELLSTVEAVVVSEPLPLPNIYGLLKKKFKDAGKEVSKEVIKLIVELVGTDLTELRHETDKLLNYPGELTEEVVRAALFSSGKVSVFELVFPLLEKRPKTYLNHLEELLSGGAEPIQLVGLMETQVRQMLKLAYGQKPRLPKETLKRYEKLLTGLSVKELLRLLKTLTETEFAIKKGEVEPALALKKVAFYGQNR